MGGLDLSAKSHQFISTIPWQYEGWQLPTNEHPCLSFLKGMTDTAQCAWYLILSLRHCRRALVHIPRSVHHPDTQTLKCFTLMSKRTLYYVYIEHEQCGKHRQFCIRGSVSGQHWGWRCSCSHRGCIARCATCHEEPKLCTSDGEAPTSGTFTACSSRATVRC